MSMRRYRRKPGQFVIAVRLDLDTDGFTYRKWDDAQQCKRGDFIVDNDGDTYTVDGATFLRTYRQVGPGRYEKIAPVWAAQADTGGSVKTREGTTHYRPGDYVVSNDSDGRDSYAISREKFEAMYELDAS